MEEQVKKVLLNLEQARDEMVANLDSTIHAAGEIVEQGNDDISHHEVPAEIKMLPFQTVHCPLATTPLYPPPSVARPERPPLVEMGREVLRCLQTRASNIKDRSIKDMDDFSAPKSDSEN